MRTIVLLCAKNIRSAASSEIRTGRQPAIVTGFEAAHSGVIGAVSAEGRILCRGPCDVCRGSRNRSPDTARCKIRMRAELAVFGQAFYLILVYVLGVDLAMQILHITREREPAPEDAFNMVEGALDHLCFGVFDDGFFVRSGHDHAGIQILILGVEDVHRIIIRGFPCHAERSDVGEDAGEVLGQFGLAVVRIDALECAEYAHADAQAPGRSGLHRTVCPAPRRRSSGCADPARDNLPA